MTSEVGGVCDPYEKAANAVAEVEEFALDSPRSKKEVIGIGDEHREKVLHRVADVWASHCNAATGCSPF
jgi:hypothetical protein